MASVAKVWIISRYGWEYDDSRYYRPESDGGYPVSAFTFPELAMKFCDEKNIAEMRAMGTTGLGDYVSSWDHDKEDEDYKQFLESHFLDQDLEYQKPPSEIDEKIIVEILNYFRLNFFEVIEVELLA